MEKDEGKNTQQIPIIEIEPEMTSIDENNEVLKPSIQNIEEEVLPNIEDNPEIININSEEISDSIKLESIPDETAANLEENDAKELSETEESIEENIESIEHTNGISNKSIKKSNTPIIVLIIILSIALVGVIGYTIYISKEESYIKDENKDNKTLLEIGKWGIASKQVSEYLSQEYKDQEYVDVPVSVTKITRGPEAEDYIKNWFDSQSIYKYEEPKENTEWILVDYQMNFNDLIFDEGTIGTTKDFSTSISGLDGSEIRYNNTVYIVSTLNLSRNEYVHEKGIYSNQFIATIPIECKDYIIKIGSSTNGKEAIFKGE